MKKDELKKYVMEERMKGKKVVKEDDMLDYEWENEKKENNKVGKWKMGGDEMDVVDIEIKVRGIEGMRVWER